MDLDPPSTFVWDDWLEGGSFPFPAADVPTRESSPPLGLEQNGDVEALVFDFLDDGVPPFAGAGPGLLGGYGNLLGPEGELPGFCLW